MNKLGKVAVALAMALVTVESFGARLPVGYREVEWIESTGQQSINLGFTPDKSKTGVVMEFNSGTYVNGTAFFGTGWANNAYLFNQQGGKYMFHGANVSLPATSPNCDMTLTIIPDGTGNGALTIDNPNGSAWKTTTATVGLTCGGILKIFGLGKSNMSSFRLYRLTVTERTVTSAAADGGEDVVTQETVHDYIPCYREADGEIGLYDIMESDPAAAFKADANQVAKFKKGMTVLDGDALDVLGAPESLGSVTPAYGVTDGLAVGEIVDCLAPACCTNTEGTIVYECRGYTVYTNGFVYVEGTGNSFEYTHPDCVSGANLVWNWAPTHYKLDLGVVGGGTVDVEPQFAEPGSVFTVTATPNAGMKFWRWTGTGVADMERYRTSATVTLTEAKTLTANFYDPATATRIVRYVTPSGAGTKDGTSWENAMSSVATAYASVGENPSGGEVWVRYGTYTVTSVSMLPDITVRGGFAGDETLAEQADPENNPTIFSNGFDGNETWTDGEDTWPVWTSEGGKWWFNEPPQDGDRKMYSSFRSYGDSYAFIRYDNGALGHTEFHGLTFTRYWASAIRVKSENDDPIVMRKCRFLRLGWLTNNSRFVVQLIGTGVDMEDCEFVGLTSPIYVATKTVDSPRRTARFKRCRISTSQECWNTSSGYSPELLEAICCGIAVLRNVSLTVQDCRFDRNVSTTHGAVYANTLGDVLIENTVFSRGCTSSNENGGTLGYYWKGQDAGSFTVRNCRFERCCTKAGGTSHVNQGAAIGVWGGLNGGIIRGLVENTAFIGNYTEGDGKESRGSSCVCFGSNCYQQGGYCAFTFLNCLFEGNEAIHPKNGGAGTTVGNSWTQSPRAVFANCVFKDNVCGKIDAETNMVYAAEFGREGNPYFAFVNSIFENSDENMLPWTNGKSWFCFANCVTDQPNAEFGKGSSTCYRYEPMDAGVSAGLDPDPRTNGVVVARGVAEDSVYRRKGRPIWLGTDGEVYLYDAKGDAAKPWRSCRYGVGRKTDEEAAAVGVSRSMPSIPDAFAKDRSRFKTALGQLDFGVPGMMLFVR